MKTHLFAENYSETFTQNKLFMQLAKTKFVNLNQKVIEIVVEFKNDHSDLRFSFCENFRLFGNSPRTWCGGGEDDIKALCQCLVHGWQDADARRYSTSYINKARKIVMLDDREAWFDLCQSIYRSAQANAPLVYEVEAEKISDYLEIHDEDEDYGHTDISEQVQEWVSIATTSSDKVKAGNHYPIKKQKTKLTVQSTKSLFELGGVA